MFYVTPVAGTQANAISMTTPNEGQYLTIYNDDNDAATFAEQTVSAYASNTFNYINGEWRLTAKSDVTTGVIPFN